MFILLTYFPSCFSPREKIDSISICSGKLKVEYVYDDKRVLYLLILFLLLFVILFLVSRFLNKELGTKEKKENKKT